MAAIGTVLSVAQTLFAALECSVLKDICSTLGYKSQLEDLKSTVTTVQSVLLDAAASEELTHASRDYIEKLKAAVYDADDLFDEFRTLAERKQQLKAGKLSKKVRLFFSSENPLKVAYRMSKEIKKIGRNLDGIARDHTNFRFAIDSNRFAVDNKHVKYSRKETCSYVNAPNVIGREADVESIVGKLLDLNGDKGARFLTVVGIGGMGKTTLAQLVCADQRVKNGFSSKVWWVCVADEDNNQFDTKKILSNILDLATGSKHQNLSLEEVQMKLRQELEGKKYLLVLDDVWNENKVKWMEMKEFLMLGSTESRIIVTTRSHDVAKAVGNSDVHVLEGLSDENSWNLFKVTAFEEKLDSQINHLEVEIGKKIVKQCSNVPLAIKVVGSLLCGQGINKWQTFEKSGLGDIRKGDNQIMSILKLSYHNLELSLKSCFTYCALFPKDYEIEKEMLIRLWTAQGFIVPFDRGQSIEDAGEEHFLILLRRCFFQDVKMDKLGNIESFKMHDLIHDVAQEVAGREILVATPETSNVDDKVRHVFEGSSVREKNFYSNVKFRSYFRHWRYVFWNPIVVDFQQPLDNIFTFGGCLRTLTLVNVGMKKLPNSIGELLHLRYLDLSGNSELETLPGSLTKLHNLQILTLKGCRELRELPKKLCSLVNLMHLNIKDCINIRYMPVGMDKLTSLRELSTFVVVDESSSGDKRVGQLKDLKFLVNLQGRIDIKMQTNLKRADVYDWEGSCLEGAEHLQAVCIDFSYVLDDGVVVKDEALLEKILPHPNVTYLKLKSLRMIDYNWAALPPNLVRIKISDCSRLKHLPMLCKLIHLKSLHLYKLDKLEYIDETSCSSSDASVGTESKEDILFPSLESLVIEGVPKLKGIFEGMEIGDSSSGNNARLWQRSFPRLSKLIINCNNVTPTSLDELEVIMSHPVLKVDLGRVEYLKLLPAGRITEINLYDKEVESLAEVRDVFTNCSSIRTLALIGCSKLKHLLGALEHLTTLESLNVTECGELKWEEGEDDDGMPWRQLNHNLRSLKLTCVQSLENLPRGMQYLTSLQDLIIDSCLYFERLPEWISCLSSLQSLSVRSCRKLKSMPKGVQNLTSLKRLDINECSDELKRRCQEPDGEDWPIIKHIPKLVFWWNRVEVGSEF